MGHKGLLGEGELSVAVISSQGLEVGQLLLWKKLVEGVDITLALGKRNSAHLFRKVLNGYRVHPLKFTFDVFKGSAAL